MSEVMNVGVMNVGQSGRALLLSLSEAEPLQFFILVA